MSSTSPQDNKQVQSHVVGRWRVSKLLRKGHNTWLHEGIDIHSKKTVVLKFIGTADKSWIEKQAEQIQREIEALRRVRHKHIIKLYAYNLDTAYPLQCAHRSNGTTESTKTHGVMQCILQVLEYAVNGELLDVLYYTSGFEESIARTYFRQVVSGVECCHNKGIVHRDLRLKNLLLDANYRIKISNFSMSKVIKSDADFALKTKFFGSVKSYQAPELLSSEAKPYSASCDIFSLGVILFILLSGYPPFEEASRRDKWYKQIADKKFDKFWKSHQNPAISGAARNLLNNMLLMDPSERVTIADIKAHPWYTGATLGRFALVNAIRQRNDAVEQLRRGDIRKMDPALKPTPGRLPGPAPPYRVDMFPLDMLESVQGGVYTYGWPNTRPVYDFISAVIASDGRGSSRYSEQDNTLYCKIATQNTHMQEVEIRFSICMYQSRLWTGRCAESDGDAEDLIKRHEDIIYVALIQRTQGDEILYQKLKSEFLLLRCSSVFKGLPLWARHMPATPELDSYSLVLLVSGFCRRLVSTKIVQLLADFCQDRSSVMPYDSEDDVYDDSLLNFEW